MTEYRYHPLDAPIPEGWVLANDMRHVHHGIYSVLIKKNEPEAPVITADEVRVLLVENRRQSNSIQEAIYRMRGGKERRKES